MRAEVFEAKVLERWSSATQPIEETHQVDLRGRTVRDADGNQVGQVEELFVDPDTGQVRFMEVSTGGLLGIGRKHHLVPVDLVASTDDRAVLLSVPSESVTDGPEYHEEFIPEVEMDHYADVYAHYNVQPYWSDGSVYPRSPTTTG